MIKSITSGDIISEHYGFFDDGNLQYREDTRSASGNKEDFTYDNYNQLETWTLSKNGNSITDGSYSMTIDGKGNITEKSDIGYSMNYNDPNHLHAVSSIQGNPDLISEEQQSITYTDFKKVESVAEGNKQLFLSYGLDDQRRKSIFYQNGSVTKTRFYLGDYEEDHLASGDSSKVHYIAGGNGLAAIYIESNGVGQLYYAYTDYLGSLKALTDKSGSVVERYEFDPWGNRRNPIQWEAKDDRASWLVDRGYTMHEHLDGFSLINMNGRVYDPTIGRFLSPDPQLQDPGYWLNYNRYTYCLNNPLIYTDPSGEYALIDDVVVMIVGGVINLAVNAVQGNVGSWGEAGGYFLSGAVAGEITLYDGPVAGGVALGVGNDLTAQVAENGWDNINWAQTTMSGFIGGATAYVGGQISGYVSPYASKLTSNIASPVVREGLTQGVTNSASGFVIGTGVSKLSGNDWETAFEHGGQGALFGGGLGLITGSVSGLHYSKKHGLDPWSGESKWRTEPAGVQEQLALDAAKQGAGKEIMQGKINDPYWKNHQKWNM